MGDANVRRPVATRFEHGVDFGLLVHKSPFMADKRDPLVLSNYIFELLEVNPGVAGFLIQLHTEDVDAVVESVTAHAEKGARTKTTLYVGQEEEEEEEVEEEEEDYQHAACRILNGIAKRIETTLQALPPGTPGKAQALAALQAFKQALKDETSGIPLRERLPSASRATENDFDLTSTKVFLTPPPPSKGNLWIASKSMSPQ